jgi:hypothetical protein
MGPINPFVGYLAAGSLLIGVAAGWKVKDWQCDAAYAKALAQAEKQRQEMQGKIDEISASYEAERDQADLMVAGTTREVREIYKTLPAVPVDCAVDVRVVGMLEGTVSDANARATGKPSE